MIHRHPHYNLTAPQDLDEKLDGVAKLGSNMYFYTGPGGNDSPPLDSDDEDLPIKKADAEPARKSSRANKGTNRKLEREDEVVDMPQVKVTHAACDLVRII